MTKKHIINHDKTTIVDDVDTALPVKGTDDVSTEAADGGADGDAENPLCSSPPSLWKLFTAFIRIGAFTFGGGYAMLPMLETECVDKTGWITKEELLDYFAIGQCTPGVIAVNTATFVGKKKRGVLGAFVATAGVVLPSLVIICVIAALLQNYAEIRVVKYALHGIRVAVGVLILNTVIKLVREKLKDWLGYLLCVLAFVIVAFFGVSPVFIVVGAALVGIARYLIFRRRGRTDK